MSAAAYQKVIGASVAERRDLFLTTAARLGAPIGNIEKDFWVCWTLDQLYHSLPDGGPRLLFKGGTALSKAHGLIERFSEDIDVTVFRDDLNQPASVEELEALSGNKRAAKLNAIRAACRAYITGQLCSELSELVKDATKGEGRVTVDPADPDGQTLLVWYPAVEAKPSDYIRPAVRIESGAKSALDPHGTASIKPYIADDVGSLNLTVQNITTINADRTFWDKVVIAHGLRSWYRRRGVLRQQGERISRHYYDLHCLSQTDVGTKALAEPELGADCVRHARMFFNRPDLDLASAQRGTFSLIPDKGMMAALERDYAATTAMIFGPAPDFKDVLASITTIETQANAR